MSYSLPRRRSLGQTLPQAVAFTCADGTIVGVPPGMDANALCLEHQLKPDIPTDVATMPQPGQPNFADTINAINASVAAQTAQAAPPPPVYVPDQVPLAPLPVAPSTSGWVIPVVALGALGWFLWIAK